MRKTVLLRITFYSTLYFSNFLLHRVPWWCTVKRIASGGHAHFFAAQCVTMQESLRKKSNVQLHTKYCYKSGCACQLSPGPKNTSVNKVAVRTVTKGFA